MYQAGDVRASLHVKGGILWEIRFGLGSKVREGPSL